MAYDDEVIRERVLATGSPGDGFDTAEAAQMRADMDEMLSRPYINVLTDVPDVAGGAADGETLIRNTSTGQWEPGMPASTLALQNGGVATRFSPVETINATSGLIAEPYGPDPRIAILRPRYGTTANTFAEGNHVHAREEIMWHPIPETGVISGGTRTLLDDYITGLDPTRIYMVTAGAIVDVRGAGTGAGRVRLEIDLVRSNPFNQVAAVRPPSRHVAGVDWGVGLDHPGTETTGTSQCRVIVRMAYVDGDPTTLGQGRVVLRASPRS